MQSPFKKKVEPRAFGELSMLIFGPPKVGKTTLASSFVIDNKEPVFIMTERGEGNLSLYSKYVDSWPGFLDFIKQCGLKKAEIKANHSYFVLDLVNELYEMAKRHIAKGDGKQHVSEIPHGKGWDLLKTEFSNAIRDLLDILPCIFIAHSREKAVLVNRQETTFQEPILDSHPYVFVNGKVDLIGFIPPGGNEISFKTQPGFIGGTRIKHMRKSFKLNHDNLKETTSLMMSDYLAGLGQGAA